LRTKFLPFALPDIDETDLDGVREALESGWITTGPKVRQFEAAFAAAVGARHAIAVSSCTAAMHLSLEAVGVQRDDEVITTPYTFAATAEVVRYFDARPIFVDIEPHSFNLDPAMLEEVVTERTRAILPVHVAGLPADLERIFSVARRHGLPVIDDAAHAFPSRFHGQMIGSSGDLTCFSFYATKPIATGEGGMICTNNDRWAERCRVMSLHGISHDAWKRYSAEGAWYYEIVAPGYKYNLTDIAAAMGLAQLAKTERMWQRRAQIAARYTEAFDGVAELQVPHNRADCQHAWHLYMLRLNLERLRLNRAQFIEEMKQRNIGCSVHFIPLHLHPYYQETYGYQPEDFPVSYREYQREVSLPIYSKMRDEDVQDVIDAVLETVALYQM
jgi:perosamine synthetase